jgi:hypothetical protein
MKPKAVLSGEKVVYPCGPLLGYPRHVNILNNFIEINGR